MRIGVVSDTHRNTGLLVSVAEWLVKQRRIDVLYHLGDDYEDVAALADMYLEVVQVPGIYHQGYLDGSIAAKDFETVKGVRILLLHSSEKDLTDEDRVSADIVLCGHTHTSSMRIEDGRFYLNPGHLKAEVDKQQPASFALLEVKEQTVTAEVYGLDHDVTQRMELVRSENGLYRTT